MTVLAASAIAFAVALALTGGSGPDFFRFVILGDGTGVAQPGVYEEAWREAASENPSFVVGVGDLIEGRNDSTADAEWRTVNQVRSAYLRFPFYAAPGNHDIWSDASEQLFRKHTGHEPHYGFDFGPVHITILDNSRSKQFTADELRFLEKDVQTHAAQPVKFVISHRPSWLGAVASGDPHFVLQQLAVRYHVGHVVAGHIHRLRRFGLDGVTYISMESSGGNLQGSRQYKDGWFFGITVVDVRGNQTRIRIKELNPPYGEGRVTSLSDWGATGMVTQSVLMQRQ